MPRERKGIMIDIRYGMLTMNKKEPQQQRERYSGHTGFNIHRGRWVYA